MSLHPFHVVDQSPWPILGSFSIMNFLVNFIFIFHDKNFNFTMMSMLLIFLIMFQWWRDIIRESTFQGNHTYIISMNMKMGMIMFILSEVMFFFSFFWAYFHNMLAPDIETGMIWPPMGIDLFNPFSIPLLNTIILLSSGFTVTWCHHNIINFNLKTAKKSILLTIFLGIYFSLLQIMEYKQAPFTISDSIFGSTFFMTTGFHGIHVLIGTMFLLVNYFRMKMYQFNQKHHFSFEAAAWYWHFVDIVWIILFTFMYWWTY